LYEGDGRRIKAETFFPLVFFSQPINVSVRHMASFNVRIEDSKAAAPSREKLLEEARVQRSARKHAKMKLEATRVLQRTWRGYRARKAVLHQVHDSATLWVLNYLHPNVVVVRNCCVAFIWLQLVGL
jgi:hypothetical protein